MPLFTRTRLSGLAGLLLWPLAASGQTPVQTDTAPLVTVPDSIVARSVPAIPAAGTEALLPFENLRTANFADWHPKERRMAIRTRFAETAQLHEVAMPLGDRAQLTFFRERVSDAAYRPSDPQQIVFLLDAGGAENFQMYLLDRRAGTSKLISDGTHRYVAPLWSHQGKLLAYVDNARNGRDFDLYVSDPSVAGSERRVAELEGSWNPVEWNADDHKILLQEFRSANESSLYAVDVASGKLQPLTPQTPGKPVVYGDGAWSRDGKSVYTTSDRDSEFRRMVRLDLATGQQTVLSGDTPWDVESFDVADDESLLAFFVNEDGVSRLHLRDLKTGQELATPNLPAGVAQSLRFRPNSREFAFGLGWARSPLDIYSYDPDSRRFDRWTRSELGGLNPERFVVPQLVHYASFDGRKIPAFVYHPPADRFPGRRPVYINIHGGPEAQERPDFLGSNNYVINELGIAIVSPNVRGSSGYGKTFLNLDNGMKREDSVKDIGALLDWIATQPDLDAARVMVAGGSYGGYMSLASLVHYSDRLRCGYDAVGISNFVTFLANTQDYRRDLRRVEYGDERDAAMNAFLRKISPATSADRIRKPLLVAQGFNDPRVPVTESDQIVAAVKRNDVPVWYVVAKDEGHGFRKKSNTDYMRIVLFEFMKRNLLGAPEAALGAPAPQATGE